jgi:hypothetical protein
MKKKTIGGNFAEQGLSPLQPSPRFVASLASLPISGGESKIAKKLADAYSTAVLARAVSLRSKRDRREQEQMPTMHHFARIEYSIGGGAVRPQERHLCLYVFLDYRFVHPHKCVPECGMYTDKEAIVLLHADWHEKEII